MTSLRARRSRTAACGARPRRPPAHRGRACRRRSPPRPGRSCSRSWCCRRRWPRRCRRARRGRRRSPRWCRRRGPRPRWWRPRRPPAPPRSRARGCAPRPPRSWPGPGSPPPRARRCRSPTRARRRRSRPSPARPRGARRSSPWPPAPVPGSGRSSARVHLHDHPSPSGRRRPASSPSILAAPRSPGRPRALEQLVDGRRRRTILREERRRSAGGAPVVPRRPMTFDVTRAEAPPGDDGLPAAPGRTRARRAQPVRAQGPPGHPRRQPYRPLDAGRGNPNWIATNPARGLLRPRRVRARRATWCPATNPAWPTRIAGAGHRRAVRPTGSAATRRRAGRRRASRRCVRGRPRRRLRPRRLGPRAGRRHHRRPLPDTRPHLPPRRAGRRPLPRPGAVRRRRAAGGPLHLFATEGGTAAMCYLFDSLNVNGVLPTGSTVALMVPAFTPYLEIPRLPRFGFDIVEVRADEPRRRRAPTPGSSPTPRSTSWPTPTWPPCSSSTRRTRRR